MSNIKNITPTVIHNSRPRFEMGLAFSVSGIKSKKRKPADFVKTAIKSPAFNKQKLETFSHLL